MNSHFRDLVLIHEFSPLPPSDPGVGLFFCTYFSMCTWVYTAAVAARRIRERYLTAILRQDIAYFDNVGSGEVTTRIQTDTRMCFFWSQSHIRLSTPYTLHTQT